MVIASGQQRKALRSVCLALSAKEIEWVKYKRQLHEEKRRVDGEEVTIELVLGVANDGPLQEGDAGTDHGSKAVEKSKVLEPETLCHEARCTRVEERPKER